MGREREAVAEDYELPDDIEFDPRWEVQPEPQPEDGSGGNRLAMLIAAVAMTAVVVLLAWLLANAPSVF
jgi:hypothetical protein